MFNRRELSRTLTRVAAAGVSESLCDPMYDGSRHARIIGVTGSPGAGKSTLIGRLAAARLQADRTIAVVAIDPSSPRSEGSLLGDRIRMAALSDNPQVFIRSFPSRSAQDGLTENIAEIVATLDRFGFDEIFIETVGAGQTAYGVRALADVELLVLTPGAGDFVQAMKAGIMETADIYVINKADLPGADRAAAEIVSVLSHEPAGGEARPVLSIHQNDSVGLEALNVVLESKLSEAAAIDRVAARQRAWRKFRVQQLVQRRLQEVVSTLPEDVWNSRVSEVYHRILGLLESAGDP